MLQRDPAALADSLRSTFAEHAAELTRVADGGTVSRDAVAAATLIAASAVELLAALPLTAFWRGYAAALADDVDRIRGIADAVELDTTNTDTSPN